MTFFPRFRMLFLVAILSLGLAKPAFADAAKDRKVWARGIVCALAVGVAAFSSHYFWLGRPSTPVVERVPADGPRSDPFGEPLGALGRALEGEDGKVFANAADVKVENDRTRLGGHVYFVRNGYLFRRDFSGVLTPLSLRDADLDRNVRGIATVTVADDRTLAVRAADGLYAIDVKADSAAWIGRGGKGILHRHRDGKLYWIEGGVISRYGGKPARAEGEGDVKARASAFAHVVTIDGVKELDVNGEGELVLVGRDGKRTSLRDALGEEP